LDVESMFMECSLAQMPCWNGSQRDRPPVLRWTLRWAVLELWEGFYVRAGRSRSSRPQTSADAEPVRAQVAAICWVLIR
jgi:hypothetical protein